MPSLGQRCRESHQASGSLGGQRGAPRAEHAQQLPQAQTFRNAPSASSEIKASAGLVPAKTAKNPSLPLPASARCQYSLVLSGENVLGC